MKRHKSSSRGPLDDWDAYGMYEVDPFISVVKYGVLHPQVGTTTKQILSESTSWRFSTSFCRVARMKCPTISDKRAVKADGCIVLGAT